MKKFSVKKDFLYKLNQDGIASYDLNSWEDFINILDNNKAFDFNAFLWRGQRKSSWVLESTLDRLINANNSYYRYDMVEKHLTGFKFAIRGRRGPFPKELTDDEYWALGQHYGLATPLLDWTTSPYIATFFALNEIPFLNLSDEDMLKESFSIYAINKNKVEDTLAENNIDDSNKLEFISPLTDDNPRLVNQNGSFIKMPPNTNIETIIRNLYKAEERAFALFKFNIPYKRNRKNNIEDILLSLNRMNINSSTLFSDLFGSSLLCNMRLAIPRYTIPH